MRSIKPLFLLMLWATVELLSCGDAYYDLFNENMTNLLPGDVRSVSYDGNGSTAGAPPVDSKIYIQGQSVTVLPNTGGLARTGHTFDGWNTAANGSGTAYAPGDGFPMGDVPVTLYARWLPVTYTVAFDTLGGTPVPPDQPVDYGDLATEPATDPALTGYTFAGWYTASTGGTAWVFTSMTVAGDTTIYARWTINQYTVSFDPKGGVPAPSSQLVEYNGHADKPVPDPSRAGYNFLGWFTASTGGTEWDFPADPVTDNMPLYAHWDGIPYGVTYDGNGNTGGTAPVDGTVYYINDTVTVLGNPGALKKIPPAGTVEAFKFGGWNTNAAGSGTTYTEGQTFTFGAGSVTLYAKWVPFVLRDTGPAGGLIFYDQGSFTGGWRYLEAAPNDIGVMQWGDEVDTPGASGTTVGAGYTNTVAIVATTNLAWAARGCDSYVSGGYSDWFMPSYDELYNMYQNLHLQGVGAFINGGPYWSSTVTGVFYPPTYAIHIMFFDGTPTEYWQGQSYVNDYNVRPVRRF